MSRRAFFRKVTESGIGEERLLLQDDVIGGASFAAIGNKIIFQVNLLSDVGYQPAIISSLDGGDTLSAPDKLDLKSEAGDDVEFEPYTSAPIVDYSGMVHVPISTRFRGGVRLVDVLVEDGTATVAVPSRMITFLLVDPPSSWQDRS